MAANTALLLRSRAIKVMVLPLHPSRGTKVMVLHRRRSSKVVIPDNKVTELRAIIRLPSRAIRRNSMVTLPSKDIRHLSRAILLSKAIHPSSTAISSRRLLRTTLAPRALPPAAWTTTVIPNTKAARMPTAASLLTLLRPARNSSAMALLRAIPSNTPTAQARARLC